MIIGRRLCFALGLRELRTQLEIRTGAIVRAAVKRGELVDYEEQYAAE